MRKVPTFGVGAAVAVASCVLTLAAPARADTWTTTTTGQITSPTNTKVGIGTATPTAEVEVRSNTTDSSVPRVALKVNQIRSDANIAEFKQNGTTKVFINAAGVLQADNGVKIKSWSMEVPDYVFDASRYTLAALDGVERFIKEQGHLPDVPSASELKEGGMDVAEMNLRLLKKVEELTLYLIEQDKKIRELSGEVKANRAASASVRGRSAVARGR